MMKDREEKKQYLWKILSFSFILVNIILILIIIGILISQHNFIGNNEKAIFTPGELEEIRSDFGLILGNPDAKITIVKYSDFNCGFCKRFYDDVYKLLKSDYLNTGEVNFVFKHFPIGNNYNAALAMECAAEQGKGFEMHDILFERNIYTIPVIKSTAVELGLDSILFDECFDSQKYLDKILKDRQEGIEKGVSGTPTFFINGIEIVGAQPYSVFVSEIEKILNN